MRYSTIYGIGDFDALDSSYIDWLKLNPSACSGGADAPLRTTVEPAPGLDGAYIFPPLDDAQIITLSGEFIIGSAGDESGYFAAIDTILDNLKFALDSMKNGPGLLTYSDGSYSVWKYAPIDTSWAGTVMSVTFGLVVDVFG
jgi:hypothetical protein